MRYNLLTVSYICDLGHTFTFSSKECEIRRKRSGRLVNIVVKTPNNIYVLKKIIKEMCCMGNIYESWLWHIRMGYVNFKNLVNISKKHA